MYRTKIDLSSKAREAVIKELQPRLADGVDLITHAKQAHWNVKGPSFIPLHDLFERIADEVRGYTDLIAERITALGGVAEGTAAVVAERSILPKYPLDIADGTAHVDALSSALATFGEAVRGAIDATDALGDQVTADIMTEVARGVDASLWMVESHVQVKG